MSNWTTATEDLRKQLSDGSKDKLRYRKRCVGLVNGTNITFKTFEFRRITDLASATAPEGVYVDGLPVTTASDSPEIGEFLLSSPPVDGSVVEATYYIQWFLDDELNTFLTEANEWLSFSGDYATTAQGLRPACKLWAAKLACEKLAIRWSDMLSDTFMFQDAPDPKTKTPVDQYLALAKQFEQQAEKARKGYYTRQDQSEAPLFSTITGHVSDVPPKR